MPSNALCFIVWNERQGCEIDLPKIDFSGFDSVYAIDGNSMDGTVEVLERFGVRVYRQKQRGLNAAYWEAVERCPCDNLVVFFPKGTLNVAIMPEIRKRLFAGYDLVVPGRC